MREFSLRLWHEQNPLVVHNPRLSIPTDEYAQQLSRMLAKRGKTLEDYLAISRTEWEGGLYYNNDTGPYVPSTWVMSSLWQSAKLSKDGERLRRAATVSAIDGSAQCVIKYKGPTSLEALWKDERFRLVQSIPQGTVRVMRTRPQFVPWSIESLVLLDESLMNPEVFEEIAQRAGRSIGLGTKVDGIRCRYQVAITKRGKVS